MCLKLVCHVEWISRASLRARAKTWAVSHPEMSCSLMTYPILWMDKTVQLKPSETTVVAIYRWNRSIPLFLRWCEMDFVRPQ